MTSEERLDRLERVAKLLATSGRRTRKDFNERINAVIDAHIRHEDQFAKAQARTDETIRLLAESQKELAQSQQDTETRLKKLIDIVARDRNGSLR